MGLNLLLYVIIFELFINGLYKDVQSFILKASYVSTTLMGCFVSKVKDRMDPIIMDPVIPVPPTPTDTNKHASPRTVSYLFNDIIDDKHMK